MKSLRRHGYLFVPKDKGPLTRERLVWVVLFHQGKAMDKVLYFASLLTAVAMKYITDPAERAKFAEDAKLLADGHAVEIDVELLAAAPFGNLRFGRN